MKSSSSDQKLWPFLIEAISAVACITMKCSFHKMAFIWQKFHERLNLRREHHYFRYVYFLCHFCLTVRFCSCKICALAPIKGCETLLRYTVSVFNQAQLDEFHSSSLPKCYPKWWHELKMADFPFNFRHASLKPFFVCVCSVIINMSTQYQVGWWNCCLGRVTRIH